MSDRKCMDCGTPIYECMGSVLARDFTAWLEGKIEATQIRERCGHCVMSWKEEGRVVEDIKVGYCEKAPKS